MRTWLERHMRVLRLAVGVRSRRVGRPMPIARRVWWQWWRVCFVGVWDVVAVDERGGVLGA